MAYGFEVTNGDDQIVINDTQALYVKKSTGTLSNSGTTNMGYYKFYSSGNASLGSSSEDIILWTCPVGKFISFNLGGTDTNVGEMCSDSSSISYVRYTPRTSVSNPTGFGVAVYNESGQCTWDSDSIVTPISNGGRLESSSMTSKTWNSGTYTGSNAVALSGGNLIADFDQGYWTVAAKRLTSTTWRFENEKVYDLTGTGISGGTTFESDLSFMLGSN
tara:strand:- start:2992 stop:3645 length:654 start_codon:yes stop_codon:yes gene_type:complete